MATGSDHRRGSGSVCGLMAGVLAAAGVLAVVPPAVAGGSPENTLLIIDPASNDSLYIGNYYLNARQIPAQNVIYMFPGAANYPAFVSYNLDALFGALANTAIGDHIDYIVVMPGAPFYVSASGLVSDTCSPVTRFSISSVYTMAFIASEVLTGTLNSQNTNRYYNITNPAQAFDSSTAWLNGVPSNNVNARRYFIGCLLGYTGSQGNTLADVTAMIDRSVAVDGTRPAGTFYFMNNPADPARNVRASQYAGAVSLIQSLGGQSEIIGTTQEPATLPIGRHDCLGIMTGAATLDIDGADMTILPGAFCDHLTSFAGRFDTTSQTKLSRWIAKGASGSWGTVEEPCNYTGKFPHARIHARYLEGLSLGETALRNAGYTPFQGLLYGDPLTRPFAYIPTVSVNDAPPGPVGGTIVLTPTATTPDPSAFILGFDLLIDGVLFDSTTPGGTFTVDTTLLTDGWHDLRVLAYDNRLVRQTGRWRGALTVNNIGRSVAMNALPASGDWTTPFVFTIAANAGTGTVTEVRVVQNGRVVASGPGPAASLTVYGLTLGAGPVKVQAEALFASGRIVRSAPTQLNVAYSGGTPSGQPPAAFGFTKHILKTQPFLVELPATFDNTNVPLTFQVITPPTKATVPADQTGAYRLMRPVANAAGRDSFTFQVTSSSGNSNVATVNLVYDWFPIGDMNCDGVISFDDIDPFVLALSGRTGYEAAHPDCYWTNADVNADGQVDFNDIDPFVALLTH